MPGPVLRNFERLQNSEDLYTLIGSELCFLAPAISRQVIDNPVTQQAAGNFMDRLQSRFGLNVQQAASIANNLIPTVLKRLVQKTVDPADNSFNLQKIFNEVSGGKTGGPNVREW
ncbi:MAG TPA: hypothetical protein VKA92_05690 [Segetibacter sp.]|nr:hypothetical protein [Segetibacter sp.]